VGNPGSDLETLFPGESKYETISLLDMEFVEDVVAGEKYSGEKVVEDS
jgi:hypothetical protein